MAGAAAGKKRGVPGAAGDFRALSSRNGSTSAPVHIFYVADVSRFWQGAGQPDPHIGDIVGDLSRRRGKIQAMRRFRKGAMKLSGTARISPRVVAISARKTVSSMRASILPERRLPTRASPTCHRFRI